MVEGLLLPVFMPEVQSLHRMLLDRAFNRCMSPLQDESTDCDTHTQFNSQGTNVLLKQVKLCLSQTAP